MTTPIFNSGNTYNVIVQPVNETIVIDNNRQGPTGPTGPTGPQGPRGYGVENNGVQGQILLSNGGYNTVWTYTNTINVNNALTSNNSNYLGGNSALDLIVFANGVSNTAYSNAVVFASNASNINTGTVNASLLSNSGVVANTYGNSSVIPVITVDNKGRITAATTNALPSWQQISSNTTATAGQWLMCDTSSGAITVTLPTSPNTNVTVKINSGPYASSNNLTVARNSSTIMSLAEDLTVSDNNLTFELVYNGSTWRIA